MPYLPSASVYEEFRFIFSYADIKNLYKNYPFGAYSGREEEAVALDV